MIYQITANPETQEFDIRVSTPKGDDHEGAVAMIYFHSTTEDVLEFFRLLVTKGADLTIEVHSVLFEPMPGFGDAPELWSNSPGECKKHWPAGPALSIEEIARRHMAHRAAEPSAPADPDTARRHRLRKKRKNRRARRRNLEAGQL